MVILRRVIVHVLEGHRNSEADVLQALSDEGPVQTGLKIDGPNVELIVGACEPEIGNYVSGKTEVIQADKALRVFEKIHVLPYKDTFRYNYDCMYHENIVPYFNNHQVGEFTEGFEFSSKDVRFQVIGVSPDKSFGVVGKNTEVFYEGPPIERNILGRLHLVPYEDGLPEKYRPSKLSLDDAGLIRDFVKPHFEQRSSPVKPNDVIEIKGVNFKVVACRPADGGGVGKDTEFVCQGVALKKASTPASGAGTGAAKTRAKAKAKTAAAGASQATAASDESQSKCTVS
eukprot:TRINITY_DN56858_c0_g1_i1.p1 TRINITY_DN56858_c0_g1~~TRINITY_DN56858_c0_g1_i1.p1  ORF type:complete len:309 (+),score=50.69 TRINITY_DN56858_c0_g1_i1:70-927(+)